MRAIQTKLQVQVQSECLSTPCFQEEHQEKSTTIHHPQGWEVFEAFKRNLLVTAMAHGCEEILEGDYMPGYDDDSQELFQQKQDFMYSAFNKVLQSDMGKTIVRKYAPTLDAQSVWKEI